MKVKYLSLILGTCLLASCGPSTTTSQTTNNSSQTTTITTTSTSNTTSTTTSNTTTSSTTTTSVNEKPSKLSIEDVMIKLGDSYDIEITGLSKFWHAYECYIKKACDGILIGREFEHPNKQTIEFRNIIIEKNNRSGSSEIYFSFEDISNYYKNFHLIFLELLQTKIDKKEFELTGDILGAHKRGGILPYKFRSIRISGIPKLKEAETSLLEPNADGLADCTAQELQLCSLPKSGRTEFRISIASCSDIFLLLVLNSANSFIS